MFLSFSICCFCPSFFSDAFASSGEDKRVRIWMRSEHPDTGENIWKMDIKCDYDQVPHALAYRPKSSILAVAEK